MLSAAVDNNIPKFERILIFRLGSLGDTLIALPCLNRIVELWPDAERIALTNIPVSGAAPSLGSVLGHGGFVNDFIDYPVGARHLDVLVPLARRIAAFQADALIYMGVGRSLAGVCRDIAFFRLAGVRRIIGAPLSHDLLHRRLDPETGFVEREVERLVRCLAALGPIDLHDPAAWNLRLTPPERAAADRALAPLQGRPFLALNMGGKLTVQHWGPGRWRALLDRLAGQLDLSLAFVGGEEDRPDAERAAIGWPHLVINACGRLSPRETSALLERATAFVGHDSGPLHLAAAAGVPCVGLFGSNNRPRMWHPMGEAHRIIHDQGGIERITVTEVEAAILEIVRRGWRHSDAIAN